jgi:sugar phosphate isomerase/epimerase
MPLPLSIQLYTVRELTKTPADFRKVVSEIAKIGYAGVETAGFGDMSAKEFATFLGDNGIVCSSIWANITPENVTEIVDRCRTLNVRDVVSCVGPDQFKTIEDAKKVADDFERQAELLAPHGINFCYHNHWWEFEPLNGTTGWEVLFSRTKTLKCQIDMYWASNFGEVDVPALIRKYAARTPLYHVKDGPLVKGQPHTAVGKGKHDITSCIKAVDEQSARWLIVELDDYVGGHPNMMDAVRDSHAWLTQTGLARGRA